MTAYFLMGWVDLEGGPTSADVSCVDNFYAQVHLFGQHRPVGPPLLVYGPMCAAQGHRHGAAVSAFFYCTLSQLTLPPVTTLPRTASDYCLKPW